jgi:hypothetical protein
MDEITKQNDIFVATLTNPQASLLDLQQSNINANNTGLLSMDDYKKSDFVKEKFTQDGKFNDTLFKQVYTEATNKYSALTDSKAIENMQKDLEYDPNNIYRPIGAKTKDVSPILTKINNPFQEQLGYSSLFGRSDSNLSVREIAQNSQIFDITTGKFKKETPNDLGIFGNIFSEPIVYAQYDEDGTHLDSENRAIKHSKGEYKINKDGKFYTETLGDREIYGKEAVAITDILTKEGT